MDMNNILLMNMLAQKMSYNSARQESISQNIANVDTPDYRRKEIEKPNFKGMVKSSMGGGLVTTHPMHISGLSNSTSLNSYTSGEEVQLDMEAYEMMKNNQDFAKASSTYKKMVQMMNTAVGSNSN